MRSLVVIQAVHLAHCKNKVVILAKYLVTMVARLSLLCNFTNAVLEKIHAVEDTHKHYTFFELA